MAIANIDKLIDLWQKNDEHALNHLIYLAYGRLHASARKALGYFGNNGSIQATELVSELYLHFRQQKVIKYQSAQHFFSIATLKLRQILNTRHEKNTAGKRNHGRRESMSIIDNNPSVPSSIEMLVLDNYLNFIESVDPLNARIVELKSFWEFDNVEISEMLGVSESTISRKWKISKALIAKKIKENDYYIQ